MKNTIEMICDLLKTRAELFDKVLCSEDSVQFVKNVSAKILSANKNGKKVLLCGNGGSSAEASHFATELMVRYKHTKNGIFAISLNADSSVLTAISNDYCFESIYETQVENIGKNGDIFVAFSTSGNSVNVVNGLRKAKQSGLTTVAFLGNNNCGASPYVDYAFYDCTDDTAIIQEHHQVLIHLICEVLEQKA